MTDSATGEPSPAATRWGWSGLVLIGLALLAIGNLTTVDGDVNGEAPTADTARVRCEDFVTERLKAPDTADFALPTVSGSGRSTWTVSGAVAVTNDAGAVVRVDYKCTVHGDSSGQWSLVELDHAQR